MTDKLLHRVRQASALGVTVGVIVFASVLFGSHYSKAWGWKVGVAHPMVLFKFTDDGRVRVGDPGVGQEYWDLQALRDLWHGEYVCLERTD